MQNTINHVLKYQETKKQEELIQIDEKVSLKNSRSKEDDQDDEKVNVEKLYIEDQSVKLSQNSKSRTSQVSKSSKEPMQKSKGEKVEFKKVPNQKSKEQVSVNVNRSPQPKKKKPKNKKKFAVMLNKNDEYEFMNLSFGTFGTYDPIDE